MNVIEKNFVGGLRPSLLSLAAGRAYEKPAKISRGRPLYRRITLDAGRGISAKPSTSFPWLRPSRDA